MKHVMHTVSKPEKHKGRGVDKFFKTLAKLASSSEFSLAKSENNWPGLQKLSVRGEKKPRQAGEWACIFTHQS
jgi:hypothetical protein